MTTQEKNALLIGDGSFVKTVLGTMFKIPSLSIHDASDGHKAIEIGKLLEKYKMDLELKKEDICIYDGFVGDGYGIIGKREISLIKKRVIQDGIILDPVYTAKAFLGLENLMQKDLIKHKNIIFIHK